MENSYQLATVLEEDGLDMVRCPSQPGKLLISRQACAQRFLLAHSRDFKVPKDEFGVALASSLTICRSCPDGRYHSRTRDGRDSKSFVARSGPSLTTCGSMGTKRKA